VYVYLQGEGMSGLAMAQVADRFAQAYPQAAHLIPDASLAAAEGDPSPARRWFPAGTDDRLAERVAVGVAPLVAFLREAQAHFRVAPVATALVAFGHGATLALATALAVRGLVGRVVAIGGRYPVLPESAPDAVIHLVHGKDDAVVPARHAVEAATRLIALGGDVTADVVPGIGHEAHPELIERALGHLQTFLPRRVWEQALAEAPLMATRASSRELARPVAHPAANDPA
jgi:phospholipase/carboxylesterase